MLQWNEIYKRNPKSYKYYSLTKPHRDLAKVSRCFKKGGAVLDLGCGSGRNMFYLCEKGFKVSAIDIAPEGIRQIKKTLKKSDAVVGNVYKRLPYKNEQFDAIISIQVLQHATEEKIKSAIKEMHRILKPGGYIFVTVCGRLSKGKVRYVLVKTAKKIAPNTYVPTIGGETGLTHFIYNKKILLKHFKAFITVDLWKDERDYYCILAKKPV